MSRDKPLSVADVAGGYAFLAIIVLLLGIFWYMFTIGVIVTLDKRECNRLNIGETCIVVAVPE
jgi:hypothetical protein